MREFISIIKTNTNARISIDTNISRRSTSKTIKNTNIYIYIKLWISPGV